MGCLRRAQVWVVGLDSCDDGVSVIQRDLETGTLTPTALVSPINPSGNHLNIDKVSVFRQSPISSETPPRC